MFAVSRLTAGYHGTSVLRDVSLEVGEHEVVAILGRNGMGKTSLMKAIMGLLPWARGSVVLHGAELSGLPTHERAIRGIGYVPQGRGTFAEASVEQNLCYGHVLAGRRMRERIPERVFEVFPWIHDRLGQQAGTLSGGEQQMLAIARVLVAEPRLLLLDEPTEGLAPAIVEQLRDTIADIARTGDHAILLVEQNLRFALTLASRGYVLEKGAIVAEGTSAHLQREDIVSRHLAI